MKTKKEIQEWVNKYSIGPNTGCFIVGYYLALTGDKSGFVFEESYLNPSAKASDFTDWFESDEPGSEFTKWADANIEYTIENGQIIFRSKANYISYVDRKEQDSAIHKLKTRIRELEAQLKFKETTIDLFERIINEYKRK